MTKSLMKDKNIKIRRANERGHAQHGWLDSYHTFSFADYYDPQYPEFRSLRVINEDRVEPAKGFGAHSHHDMEILTYIVEGSLKHQDSMGHESVINAGDVQKITAGTGIVHAEFNASATTRVHFLQIWILPKEKGLKPSYQQFTLATPKTTPSLLLIGSSTGGKNIVQFSQEVDLYRGLLKKNEKIFHAFQPSRAGWLQMISGSLQLEGHALKTGDGAAIEQSPIHLEALEECEFLLFDLV